MENFIKAYFRVWISICLFCIVCNVFAQAPWNNDPGYLSMASNYGDSWQSTAQSVAFIVGIDGNGQFLQQTGTAVMLNNTAADLTPYVLTAAHILYDEHQNLLPSQLFLRFGYREVKNVGLVLSAPDLRTGFTVRAVDFDSDLVLIELDQKPAGSVVYAGWNRQFKWESMVTCLHHGSGDAPSEPYPMQIASKSDVDDDDYSGILLKRTKTSGETTYLYEIGRIDNNLFHTAPCYNQALSNLYVLEECMDYGNIQEGSSGAPLFNGQHQIIGLNVATVLKGYCSPAVSSNYHKGLVSDFPSLKNIWEQAQPYLDPLGVNPTEMPPLIVNRPDQMNPGNLLSVDDYTLPAGSYTQPNPKTSSSIQEKEMPLLLFNDYIERNAAFSMGSSTSLYGIGGHANHGSSANIPIAPEPTSDPNNYPVLKIYKYKDNTTFGLGNHVFGCYATSTDESQLSNHPWTYTYSVASESYWDYWARYFGHGQKPITRESNDHEYWMNSLLMNGYDEYKKEELRRLQTIRDFQMAFALSETMTDKKDFTRYIATINVPAGDHVVSVAFPGEEALVNALILFDPTIFNQRYLTHFPGGIYDPNTYVARPVENKEKVVQRENDVNRTSYPLQVYPNPVKEDKVTITIGKIVSTQDATIEIFSLSGRMLYAEKYELNRGDDKISLKLSSGIRDEFLIIKLRVGELVKSFKLIKD